MRTRLMASLAVALLAFGYVYGSWLLWSGYSTDFDQLHWAAEAVLRGADPYTTIRSINTRSDVSWGLLYPMPAVVTGSLFVWMPLPAARACVAALGAGALTWLLTRERGRWPILLSAAMRSSISLVQFTPFLAAAALSPWFGWALACKPNAGVAVVAGMRRKRDVIVACGVAVALVLASTLIAPDWFVGWFAAIRASHYLRPFVLRPGGAILLIAALRWRRPEARWLVMTALIPATANVYEALPLLVIGAWSFRELLILGILSHVADIGAYVLRADASYAALVDANATTILWLFYLPVLVLILRRPNHGVEARPVHRSGEARSHAVDGESGERVAPHDAASGARSGMTR